MTVDWSAIRADYEQGMTLRQLAGKYSISKTVIGERKYKEKWTERTKRTDNDNPNGTTHDLNALVRVHTALKIYLEERPTWDEIAARSGYSSRGAAYHAVKRELERRVTYDIKELRTEDLYMLQQLQAKCFKEATDKSNQYWSFAVDRFAVLSKRKSELMGLDTKPEEFTTPTIVRSYGVEVGKV